MFLLRRPWLFKIQMISRRALRPLHDKVGRLANVNNQEPMDAVKVKAWLRLRLGLRVVGLLDVGCKEAEIQGGLGQTKVSTEEYRQIWHR